MKVKIRSITRRKPSIDLGKLKLLVGHSTDIGAANRVMLPLPKKKGQ